MTMRPPLVEQVAAFLGGTSLALAAASGGILLALNTVPLLPTWTVYVLGAASVLALLPLVAFFQPDGPLAASIDPRIVSRRPLLRNLFLRHFASVTCTLYATLLAVSAGAVLLAAVHSYVPPERGLFVDFYSAELVAAGVCILAVLHASCLLLLGLYAWRQTTKIPR